MHKAITCRYTRIVLLIFLFAVTWMTAPAQIYVKSNSFGSAGSGGGQFGIASYAALDQFGNLYVTDSGRVQKFAPDGTYLAAFGAGHFDLALGIAISSEGIVYVANYHHTEAVGGQILKFDLNGNYLGVFAGTSALPYGLAFDPSGLLYSQQFHHYVVAYDTSGHAVKTYSNGYLADIAGITLDSESNLYIADAGANRVEIFRADGGFVTMGSGGSGNGNLNNPTDIAVDSHGNIFVADYGNSRIVQYSPGGGFVQNIGVGILNLPFGVRLAPNGDLYVIDRGNHRVVVFSILRISSFQAAGDAVEGQDAMLTINLSAPAPNEGAPISLSSNSTAASVPSSVLVPAGQTSLTISASTSHVSVATPVTVTATCSGIASQASFIVKPNTLGSLSLDRLSIVSGSTDKATGMASLVAPALVSTVVSLKSSNPAVVSVPAQVTIATGIASATFPLTISNVSSQKTVTVSASYGGATKSTKITVLPLAMATFSASPLSVIGGTSSTGLITLNATAASATAIVLNSPNTSAVSVPSTVVVPAGSSSVTFPITTYAVVSSTPVKVSATLGSGVKSTTITVKPPTYATFTLTPNPVKGGLAVTGTVSMTGPVAVDTPVALVCANAKATLLTNPVLIPAGASTVSFTITTTVTSRSASGGVTATVGAASKKVTLKVTP